MDRQMKNKAWMVALGLTLALAVGAPALAQTTAVVVDGKTYLFDGAQARYETDGKTFLIKDDTVHVLEPGKPERVFPKATQETTEVVENISPATAFGGGMIELAENISVSPEDISVAAQVAQSTLEDADLDISDSYDQYAKYGLSFDAVNSVLYYQGLRVRVFMDQYMIDGNTAASIAHFDPEGAVDVRAERDLSAIERNSDGSYDPSGKLTGLYALSQAEFDARDLTEFTEPRQTSVATSGEPLTPQEKAEIYAPYAAVGVLYNMDRDELTFQGRTVRRFLDVHQTNGESFASGKFQGSMTSFSQDGGEIDISTLRDYTQPDENGYGKLIGIQVDSDL